MTLDTPIIQVNGIGEKYSKLLKNLNIYTVEDLVYHFPFRYNYFSSKKVKDLLLNDTVMIELTLISIDNILTKYGKKLTKAVANDESGKIDIIWFNKHFLKKSLKVGEKYVFSGKVTSFNNKLHLISPDIDFQSNKPTSQSSNTESDSNSAHSLKFLKAENKGLVGVYPESSGVTSKWLRHKILKIIFANKHLFSEYLPQEILEKYNFDSNLESLIKVHSPKSIEDTKAINRYKFEELFFELLRVEERKITWKKDNNGIALNNKDKEINEFISSLPFTLTEDQAKSIKLILKDMQNTHPMNRLLEGDVGTGKTVVAVIASYFAYLNGYKVLYMAPTDILANQHFDSFQKFFSRILSSPNREKPRIVLKTGSKKSLLDNNNFDIAIGTHALIFSKNKIENIGLVIVDEQHRFGVEQRAKLINLNSSNHTPHLLSMTATPIPRTLALTLYGDLDISILRVPPNKDKNIKTFIVPHEKRQKTYEWISKANEQAFIVCPLIEESEAESLINVKSAQKHFEELSALPEFKNKKLALLHGRMKPAEKTKIIQSFRGKEFDILVSTPVIEVGVDIPEATIMVIESAERYGLASLHQIRGRVGRGKKEAFCFIFMSNFSKHGFERLKHLERTSSGTELAEIDMKLRGHGDIYGKMQSGFTNFKYADISDLTTLESAKTEAEKIFENIEKYPKILQKIQQKNALIAKN